MANKMVRSNRVMFVITRQDEPSMQPYTEQFEIPYRSNMNVISALMEIQRNPINVFGKYTTPVCWDSNCLEEVCGACSMVINGKARQACTALIDQLTQPIRLAPMRTFPVVRDLVVDRKRMFEALKKVKAWIPIDGTHELGPGPRIAETKRQWAYELSTCMTCGVCLEVCPNVNEKTSFIGPAPVSQVRLFNAHPTGAMNKDERLEQLLGNGGIEGCGNSQNCVRSCPKEIPLTTSLAEINKDTTKLMFKNWFAR